MTRSQLHDALSGAGLSEVEIARKLPLFERSRAAVRAQGRPAQMLWFTPGRIEILGKHTDYAGGRSLVAAAERGFCLASAPRRDEIVGCTDATTLERIELHLGTDAEVGGPAWATYAAAVVRRVGMNFKSVRRGTEIAFASDLPSAAGMSSSSALIVGLYLAVAAANRIETTPEYSAAIRSAEDLAAYLATIENGLGFGSLVGDRGVGTFGGSEDHTAILLSARGRARQYAFCPTRLERTIALPSHVTFAVASSGVVAEKTGAARGAYNRASLRARRVLELWNHSTGARWTSLARACAAAPGAVGEIMRMVSAVDDAEFTRAELLDRFTQFVEESLEIVPAGAEALHAGDLEQFGALVARSQELAERRLGNQVAETVSLARSARAAGAYAASAFGAGFGGSVWALVTKDRAETFLGEWERSYREAFPDRAEHAAFFVTGAGPGAIGLGNWGRDEFQFLRLGRN